MSKKIAMFAIQALVVILLLVVSSHFKEPWNDIFRFVIVIAVLWNIFKAFVKVGFQSIKNMLNK